MVPKLLTRSTRFLLASGLLIPVLLIGIPALVAFHGETAVKNSFNWVTHTHEVEGAITNVVNSMVDAETGQRGFLLTRREPYLEPYDAAISRVGQQLTDLRTLTADNASQQERLREIQPLVRERLDLLAQTIAREREGEHQGALDLVNSGRGKFLMDKIRGVLRVMADEEHRLLWIRQRELSKQAGRSTLLLRLLVLVSVAVAAAVIYLLRRTARVEPLVMMCSVSRTIDYHGEWLSFEQYLQRRFAIDTSHGLSPEGLEKLQQETHSPAAEIPGSIR
jgi:CHASE3 domain sensor protein